MIKGCTKRVVVVRDIGSNFFEEAFFIVKQGSSERVKSDSDFLNEADRIVKSDLARSSAHSVIADIPPCQPLQKNHRKSRLREAMFFGFGFALSAVMCTVIYYSGMLI